MSPPLPNNGMYRIPAAPPAPQSRAGISGGYMALYGPFAFGVASLLLIWFVIVAPELERSRVATEEIQKLADTQRRTADVMERTAARLEQLLYRMEMKP